MTRVVVDRFEGELAVLIDDAGQTVDVPRGWLPDGTEEGDVVALVAHDPDDEDDRAADRLQRLRARDPGGDLDL